MRDLIDFLEDNYYTSLLLMLIGVVAMQLALQKRKHFPALRFIPIYLGFSILQSLFYFFVQLDQNSIDRDFLNHVNNIAIIVFNLLETSIFLQLLLTIIRQRLVRKLSLFLLIAVIVFGCYVIFIKPITVKSLTIIFLLESCLLLLPCFVYYYETIKFSPTDPAQDPNFWIVTGLTYFIISTFPYVLIQDYLFPNNIALLNNLQALMYNSYCIFFGLIIKRYMRKSWLQELNE